MACTTLPFKEAGANSRDFLIKNTILSDDGSSKILSILDEFNTILDRMNRDARINYGVKESLYTTEKRGEDHFVVPNQEAFDAIDAKRKEYGIYDTQESVGSYNRRNVDTLYEDKDELAAQKPDTESSKANEHTISLIKDFTKRIGVDVQSLKDISVNGIKQDANGVALTMQKLIQVVEGKEDVALPEEAMHFAVDILEQKDPTLFNKLLGEINSYNILKDVIAQYGQDKAYQIDGKPNIRKLKKEAIAKILVETIINKNELSTEKPELLAKTENWWDKIINFLKGLFSKSGFDEVALKIIGGEEIGKAEDIREGETFFQKTSQQTAIDAIQAMDKRLSKKDVEGDNKYFLDGTTPVKHRVTDLVKEWYKRRAGAFELTKTEYGQALADLKRDKGTAGHADIEHIIKNVLVDEDRHLRDIPEDDSTYVSQLNPTDKSMYNILKDNMAQRLATFPKDTVFLSEMQIFDPKANKAGTIDFLAIEPSGKVNILDWKFLDLNTDKYKDVPWYKTAEWKYQMDQYKSMLESAYGIKSQDFGQTRMIPIKAVYSQGNAKTNVLPKLLSVKIGDVNVKNITDAYLIPVGLEEESTGSPEIDALLKKLNADYKLLSDKKVLPSDKQSKAEQLNALFTAIRQLQMKQDIAPLIYQAKVLNKNIQNLIERYNKQWKGTDPKSYTDEQLSAFALELLQAEKTLNTYTNLDIDLGELFLDVTEESKTLRDDLRDTVDNARILKSKLNRDTLGKPEGVIPSFTEDFIAKREDVEDLTDPDKVIKGFARFFSSTATLQTRSISTFFKKGNRALTKAAMDTVDETHRLENLKKAYESMAKAKGLTSKNEFDLIKKKDKNELIDEFNPEFYKTLKAKIEEKDSQWIRENVNATEYNKFLTEKKKEESDRIDARLRVGTEEQNKQDIIKEKYLLDLKYNTKTTDGAGWLQYNYIKKFPKDIWESREWKELNAKGNEPALAFYNYIKERNEFYHSIGYISDKSARTFLPWIRKGLIEKMVMGGNIRLGESLLRAISLEEGDIGYGQIDPHTGAIINTIPKYFTKQIEGESSDLFKTMSLYNEMALKFKYLSDIEGQVLALSATEANKSAIATSIFGKTKYKDGKIEYTADNSRNTELLDNMIHSIMYGQKYLQSESFDIMLGKLGKFGEKVNKSLGVKILPEHLEGRQISGNKVITTMNNFFQLKTLGLSLLAPISNYFGGSIQSLINSGKYYTKKDWTAIELWINAKMIGIHGLEDKKKAIGALDYFLPLTENYNTHLAKKLSLSKINQQNIQDFLMSIMRHSDTHVQTVNFFAFIKNSIVQDGKVLNAREYLRSTPEYLDMYSGSKEERDARKDKFEKDVSALIDEKGVLKMGQVVDDQFIIPGVDRKSDNIVDLRKKMQQISKDALGNITEDDRRLINMSIYGNSFMMFKNWVPRLIDVRYGALKYNSASDAYEWGRMRTVFSVLSEDLLHSVGNLKNSILGNDKGISFVRKMWEKKKDTYEKETGKEFKMTPSEFTDLFRRNIKNQMWDTLALVALISIYLGFKANAPEPDEDPHLKNRYKFMLRAMDKLRDEITYFYDPSSFSQLISSGIFPSVQLLTNTEKILENFRETSWGLITGNEDEVKNAHTIKYLMKQFPGTNQISQYLPMLYPDLAKSLGIKAQSTQGFIH